ncbi:lipid droplet-regulating VLDL assembly factor AUP1-like isoform X2 [Liolophura sinensis]|uniref:lipid droplet-regulating VLDL assembly factor AUP1-like isoform X2 n=1 Tax=Liolophura sinensis TaxID=3198878 RepID=UPI0031584586
MGSVEIGELFESSRLRCTWSLLPLVMYFPLGIVLALVRFFIGLHTFLISKLLPKSLTVRRYILRTMCVVLGIAVRTECAGKRSKSAKILVTNHISPLDHLAVNLVLPNVTPCVWDIPDGLAWAMGFKDMGVRQGRDTLLRNVTKHCQDSSLPVLSHPEGASTSGKVGLLKFSTWPFMLDQSVQPLTLTISRLPFLQITVSPLGSTWWADLFWVLFLPYTLFTVKYLPVLTKEEEETVEAFAKRAQEAIANDLGLQVTSHSDADKVEYAKRMLFERSQAQGKSSSSGTEEVSGTASAALDPIPLADPETRRMVKQVKDVLPHVPAAVIMSDLEKTRNVDVTITNLVEGKVEYTSIEPGQSSETKNSALTQTRFAADKFGKSSNERQMSFQDRKKAMLETARRKFLEKHALL